MSFDLKKNQNEIISEFPMKNNMKIDPLIVLRRIENMRKMQNEEHQKLIVAHQNQMQQLKLQQEKNTEGLLPGTKTMFTDISNDGNSLIKNDQFDNAKPQMKDILTKTLSYENHALNLEDNQFQERDSKFDLETTPNKKISNFSENEINDNFNLHRLSTILEATSEDVQSKTISNNNFINKLSNKSNLNYEKNEKDQDEMINISEVIKIELKDNTLKNSHSLEFKENIDQVISKYCNDFDNMPLGVKSTNKLTFEQLVEEKLKIADELDKEHFRVTNTKKKNIIKTKHNFTDNKKPTIIDQINSNPQIETISKNSNKGNQAPVKNERNDNQFETTIKSKDLCKNLPRRFLKKGEGLKRFAPKSKLESNAKNQTEDNSRNENSKKLPNTFSLVKSCSFKSKQPKNQGKIIVENKAKIDKNNETEIDKSLNLNIDDSEINYSNQINQKGFIKNNTISVGYGIKNLEEEELKEFEKLEQYVDEHPSFSNSCIWGVEKEIVDRNNSKEVQNSSTEFYNDNSEDSYNNLSDSKNNISKRKVKKMSENKSEENKFKTTNKTIFEISNKATNMHEIPQKISNNNFYPNDENGKYIEKFDDNNSWIESFEKPGSNAIGLINKLFPEIKDSKSIVKHLGESQTNIMDLNLKKSDQFISHSKDTYSVDHENYDYRTFIFNDKILREKLNLLESELQKFQKKNFELTKLKEKLENELKLAHVNQKIFEKQIELEKSRMKEVYDEDYRKFNMERKIFEQYKQSVKDNPDRRERDEINKLKRQIENLEEELKSKEIRWVANNKRLKERIELLEREKTELKNELKLIEKFRIESIIKIEDTKGTEKIDNISRMKRNYNDDNKSDSHRSNNINEISESKIKKYCKNYELVQDYLQNGTNLKRSTSEKSLSSSYSSSRSSFSSISMGSANSLGLNINVKNSNDPLKASNLSSKFIIDQENKTVNNLSPSSSQLDILTIEGASSISMAKRDEIVSNTNSSKKSYNFESKLSDEEVNYKSVKFRIDSDTNIRDDNLKNNINIMNKTNHFANENNDNLCNQKYTEKILEDGSVQTFFRNGTVKEVSPDKKHTTVRFFNGDRKEIDHETSTETYFYAETKITQIIHSNGYQILKFPNGQVENHHIDKTREIIFPDKIKKIIFPNGTEESYLPNGTIIKVDDKGNKVIEYPNKQREIHTKEFKRREYPDGSIKTVYSNGISETVYSNGRVRIKDSLGNIIDDKKL